MADASATAGVGAAAGEGAAAEAAAGAKTAASRTAAADMAAGRGKRLAALPAAVRMAEKAADNPPATCLVTSVIRLRAIM